MNASGCYGASLCENAQEPTRRRIVFSIALFLIAATALFLFRLMKSRRTFYAQIECLRFHTVSVEPCHSISVPRAAGIGTRSRRWRPNPRPSRRDVQVPYDTLARPPGHL